MLRKFLFVLPTLSLLAGCGVIDNNDDDDDLACSDGETLEEVQLSGRLYVDTDGEDASIHDSSFDEDTDSPLPGISIDLFGADGTQTGSSCDSGEFSFGDLDPGSYVLSPDLDIDGNCMQRNCTRRLPQALEEGAVKIVTMGDSVPVVGHNTLFPARLASLLEDLADIDNTNVAVGGTISTQWLPGTSNFESRLAPELPDADIVVMSIGGNDIMQSLDASALQDPEGTIESTYELVEQITENVRDTVTAMRDINPNIDVVYCIYVDYGQASTFPWGLVSNLVGQEAITEVLKTARESLSVEEGILIADLFGASHQLDDPLDEYLYDALHFNDRGHTLYAEEIFMTLGGFVIGDGPLGGQARANIGSTPSWSVAAD
jgi:lysophospholipase L1-like esterase